MAKPKPQKLKEATSYDIHALLDYLLVECAVGGRSLAKRIRIPYKNVLEQTKDNKNEFERAELWVTIDVQWNAKQSESGSEKAVEYDNPSKKRH